VGEERRRGEERMCVPWKGVYALTFNLGMDIL